MLTLKICRSIYSLKSEWTILLENRSHPTSAYQSYQINEELFKRIFIYGFQRKYSPLFCCIYEDHRPILIAPLCKFWRSHSYCAFGQVNGFQLYDFIYGDQMTSEKIGECINFLINTLHMDVVSLENIAPNSLVYVWANQATEYSLTLTENEHINIHFGKNYSSWFNNLTKHTRQNIRTAYNRMQKDGVLWECRFNVGKPLSSQVLRQVINIYCNRHLERYQVKTPLIKKLYLRYFDFSTAYQQKYPDCFNAILYLNGNIAAFMSGVVEKSRTSAVIPRLSIVNSFSRYSPGMILINEVAKGFTCDIQIENLDLSKGVENYKLSAGGKIYYTYNLTLKNGK